jgi:hypothetical protein
METTSPDKEGLFEGPPRFVCAYALCTDKNITRVTAIDSSSMFSKMSGKSTGILSQPLENPKQNGQIGKV